jgi:hypothetical protein
VLSPVEIEEFTEFMGSLLRLLLHLPFVKPLMRFVLGMIAIPLFRMFLRHVIRLREMSPELEKDLEQWFKGSLILLVATRNMETFLWDWISTTSSDSADLIKNPFLLAGRLMLAVGVTELMPDQALFTIIHANPPPLKPIKDKGWKAWRRQFLWMLKGTVCKHLDRSSQVFAIMTAIFPGVIGWICYGMAIGQYLIIGLVTSRDKALDVLGEFEKQVQLQREWLIDELSLQKKKNPSELVDDWYPVEKRNGQPPNVVVAEPIEPPAV